MALLDRDGRDRERRPPLVDDLGGNDRAPASTKNLAAASAAAGPAAPAAKWLRGAEVLVMQNYLGVVDARIARLAPPAADPDLYRSLDGCWCRPV